MRYWGWILLAVTLTGCLGGAGMAPLARQYALEYPPPASAPRIAVPAMIKVDRLSAVRVFAGSDMVLRRGTYRRDVYQQQRWRVSPAEMVTEFLKRDLRHAGIFAAVLPARDVEETRFLLGGELTDFSEVNDGKSRQGLLAATMILIDQDSEEVPQRVIFQKAYQCEAAITRDGAVGFAEAMSRATAQFSEQLTTDIDRAVRERAR